MPKARRLVCTSDILTLVDPNLLYKQQLELHSPWRPRLTRLATPSSSKQGAVLRRRLSRWPICTRDILTLVDPNLLYKQQHELHSPWRPRLTRLATPSSTKQGAVLRHRLSRRPICTSHILTLVDPNLLHIQQAELHSYWRPRLTRLAAPNSSKQGTVLRRCLFRRPICTSIILTQVDRNLFHIHERELYSPYCLNFDTSCCFQIYPSKAPS